MKHLRAVIDALNAVAETRLVWERGLMNPGGPHRRLRGMNTPISVGEDECGVFGRLIEATRPRQAFVIGNAFGLSSAHIALAMEASGGERVVTLDSQSEGQGARCAAVADALARRLGLRILTSKKGASPGDVDAAVEAKVHDLIFIDGLHAHPQVTLDLHATLPFANERTVFVWHDYWIPGVPESVDAARAMGFRVTYLPTSCEMVLGTRDPETFERVRSAFPEGMASPPRHTAAERYGVMAAYLARYAIDRATGRG